MNSDNSATVLPSTSSVRTTVAEPIPGVVAMQANWKQIVGCAKSTWLSCSDAELLESEGSPAKLTGLIARVYSMSSGDANLQVRRFFEKNKA